MPAASTGKPNAPTTNPEAAPATAASTPIARSAAPCTSGRAESGVTSTSSVDAATVARLQPSPSRKSPPKTCHEVPGGASAASTSEARSTTPPEASTGVRP